MFTDTAKGTSRNRKKLHRQPEGTYSRSARGRGQLRVYCLTEGAVVFSTMPANLSRIPRWGTLTEPDKLLYPRVEFDYNRALNLFPQQTSHGL